MGICQPRAQFVVDGSSIGEEQKSHSNIEHRLRIEDMKDKQTAKLILLGAGSSGKTTIFTQLKHLYGNPSESESELLMERDPIRIQINLFETLHTLIQQRKIFNIELEKAENTSYINEILKIDPKLIFINNSLITNNILEICKKIWQDKGLKETLKRRQEFKIPIMDNCDYILSRMDNICDEHYVPTFEDLLKTRVRTTGINSQEFVYSFNGNDKFYQIYDVGGQRSERNKWLGLFTNVTSVIYVIALSGFNQVLFEDSKTNRFTEAVNLFSKTIKAKELLKIPFITFLNKHDLFVDKLSKYVPFKVDNYNGDEYDPNEILNWIKTKLMKIGKEKQELYIHVTVATDTKYMESVFVDILTVEYKRNFQKNRFI